MGVGDREDRSKTENFYTVAVSLWWEPHSFETRTEWGFTKHFAHVNLVNDNFQHLSRAYWGRAET